MQNHLAFYQPLWTDQLHVIVMVVVVGLPANYHWVD
jgi:hypothetical protein